jgi:hypothetical protein
MIVLSTLAAITAAITAMIAYKMYKTAKLQTKQALYQQRLDIYKKVHAFLGRCLSKPSIENTDLSDFYQSVGEAQFLFGLEIMGYIDKVYDKANRLCEFQVSRVTQSQNQEWTEMMDIRKWLSDENRFVEDRFKPYLTFAKKEST